MFIGFDNDGGRIEFRESEGGIRVRLVVDEKQTGSQSYFQRASMEGGVSIESIGDLIEFLERVRRVK